MGQARHTGTRYLVDEPLRVATPLIGQPLASPLRRLAAIVIDGVIVLVPTLLVIVLAAGVSLHLREPAAIAAMRGGLESPDPQVRHRAQGDLARFFAKLEAPGLPAAVKAAVEEGEIDRAATLLDGYDIEYNLSLGEGEHPENPLRPKQIRFEIERVIPKPLRAACLYGVAALYFSLFTASRRGATPGKRLVGIRVVHLGGRRLHLLEAFERFVGYLHIPGTLGLAFLDLRHDPNRRMGHDRVAHTAVLRVSPATAPPEEPPRSSSDAPEVEEQAAHQGEGASPAGSGVTPRMAAGPATAGSLQPEA